MGGDRGVVGEIPTFVDVEFAFGEPGVAICPAGVGNHVNE